MPIEIVLDKTRLKHVSLRNSFGTLIENTTSEKEETPSYITDGVDNLYIRSSTRAIWTQTQPNKVWIIDISKLDAKQRSECFLVSCKAGAVRIDKEPYLDRIEEYNDKLIIRFKLPVSGIAEIRM